MYIQPSSTLILLKGCPCDSTYRNTLYFADAASQETYFKTLAKYTLSDLSYIRVNRGEIRVEKKAEDLYDCNYLMFQNTAFGDKWFYAFINSVDYVSNTTASVKFEIDEIQTWYFETDFSECLIERTHPATDGIGEHRVPEGLEVGEYIYTKLPNMFTGKVTANPLEPGWAGSFLMVTALIIRKQEDGHGYDIKDGEGGVYFGLYSALNVYYWEGWAMLFLILRYIAEAGKSGSVYGIYYVPERLGLAFQNLSGQHHPAYFDYGVPRNYDKLDGYKPKNNKLYTWPYNGLYVTDNSGNFANFRFEDFVGTAQFRLYFCANPIPSGWLVPIDYNGISGDNYNEKFRCQVAADCVYTTDSYRQYVAEQGGVGGILTSVLSGPLINSAVSIGMGLPTPGAIPQALPGAVNAVMSLRKAETLPDQARGKPADLINVISGHWGFDGYYVTVKKELAKVIDGIFDQTGYLVNTVAKPSRKNRPHWTYIQTQGCCLLGGVPADSADKICQIHDRGITYWVNPPEVGNYSIDNSPEGEPPTPVDPVEPSTPENFIPRLTEDGILNNPYWYKDNRYYQAGYGLPNCTCYALGRWYEIQGSSTPFNFPGYWDGMDWYQMCVDAGYQTSKTVPMVGACMSWTHGTAGHVSIVEQVNYDESGQPESVVVSYSGWGGPFWKLMTITAASGWKYRDDQTFNGFGYHPSLVAQLTGGETSGTQEP